MGEAKMTIYKPLKPMYFCNILQTLCVFVTFCKLCSERRRGKTVAPFDVRKRLSLRHITIPSACNTCI